MMSDYVMRDATLDDSSFIADVIIAAEKGPSSTLGFSTLFNLPEEKVKQLLISMLEEEIEGCEFSISNFIITVHNGIPVAGLGAWIEGFDGNPPSKILKSNLINFTFPPDSIQTLKGVSHILNDFILERESLALQIEYGFVAEQHRGKKLLVPIIEKLIERSVKMYPALKKAQVQCYKNNLPLILMFERLGFSIAKEVTSNNPLITDYLPYNIKVMMEKSIY